MATEQRLYTTTNEFVTVIDNHAECTLVEFSSGRIGWIVSKRLKPVDQVNEPVVDDLPSDRSDTEDRFGRLDRDYC